MQNIQPSMSAFTDTKSHYDLLDGLRGVAAITVVWFHIFEAFATSHLDQRINHGCRGLLSVMLMTTVGGK